MPPMLEGVRVKDPLDRLAADPGQRCPLDQPVDSAKTRDRFLHLGEWVVGPPEDLVAFGNPIFLGGDQCVPELPWPVEDRRDLAIDIGLLAGDDDALLDPGMGNM